MTQIRMDLEGRHLSEEELDDVLIGCATEEARQHAASCEVCGAHLAPFQSAVSAFNEGTLGWAQAKSNTVSRDLSGARISTRNHQPLRWSVGVATMAAMAFVMTVGQHRTVADTAKAPAHQTEETASAQEIASDNAMLDAINSEVSVSAPDPFASYSADGASGSKKMSVNGVRD